MHCLSDSVLLLLACLTTGLTLSLCSETGVAKLYQATVKGLNEDDDSAEANSGGWCVVIDSLDHLLQHAGLYEASLLLAV
jgi:hypothetical protein